jgi:hypothetical protein
MKTDAAVWPILSYLLRCSQSFHLVFHLRVMPTPTPLHTVSHVPPRRGTRVT